MDPNSYVVHIVDDDEPVRRSLAFMLSTAGFAVRVHETATSFLDGAHSIRHGCLVTDLRMPDMSGVDLVRELEELTVHIPAILITGHGDVPMAVEAMKAGALDFIEKPFEDRILIEAVRRAAGEVVRGGASHNASAIRARLDTLSAREREVLSGVIAGRPNKLIAHDLDISPRTVEVHRANVMGKMEAKSLPELVRMALAAGITSH